MAYYKTTDYVQGIVRGLLSTITVPKYLKTKPTTKPKDDLVSEYIVINSLPIDADVMQRCIVNVNYHVKDLAEGIPDSTKLDAGSLLVMNILEKVTVAGSYNIDLEGQETIREAGLKEHYSNMRFSFKNIN